MAKLKFHTLQLRGKDWSKSYNQNLFNITRVSNKPFSFFGRIIDLNKEEKLWLKECKNSDFPKPFSLFLTEKYYTPTPL
ncbi:hypothetical protein E0K83_04030 [Gramella sp. BOM4]|nr:hypothetical protein [Christiangramia bathymodioli]